MYMMRKAAIVLLGALVMTGVGLAQNKYIGVKNCSMCHKTEKQGKQFVIWQGSKHSKAYKDLMSEKAAAIAKEKGISGKPVEAKECVECHTLGKTVEASMFEKSFNIEDGVQCETCHGPGSKYKGMSTMKDKQKAIAAGLHEYKDDAAIEAFCKNCHNEKSPTFKGFNFKEMRAKIIHSVPTSG